MKHYFKNSEGEMVAFQWIIKTVGNWSYIDIDIGFVRPFDFNMISIPEVLDIFEREHPSFNIKDCNVIYGKTNSPRGFLIHHTPK